jgi:5-deoxy-5-amino-3-dehydroquinate synthase
MREIRVELSDRSYPVLVGRGVVGELASLVPEATKRCAIVTQAGIDVTVDPGCESRLFTLGDGESTKTLSSVEQLCSGFAEWGMTRADTVVAVGGGVVTDVGGFAASVYHRGISVIHVSTSLLGQIDAAIGGKTGVNLPQGKNLVGAFWQPTAVICDVDTLAALPPEEMRSGFGEMAKYAFLGAPDLLQLDLVDQIAACVQVKADVVSGDEREGGRRATLNYGHTLAHALEIDGDFSLRHGEAVAVGIHFAALLAESLGRIDSARVAEHLRVLNAYELPTAMPSRADSERIIQLMARDKKALTGLTFVLDGPDGVETVTDVAPAVLRAALDRMPKETP